SLDKHLRIWEVDSGARFARVHDLPGHQGVVSAMAWEPHGFRLLYAQNVNPSLHMVDLPLNLQLPVVWYNHRDEVTAMDWSMMTHTAAIGFGNGALELRRVGLPEAQSIDQYLSGPIHDLAFSPDGRLIAFRLADNTLIAKGVGPNDLLQPSDLQKLGKVNHLAWDASSSHRLMIASHGQTGSSIRLVDAAKPIERQPAEQIRLPDAQIKVIAQGAEGKPLALLTTAGEIALWDMQAQQRTRVLRPPDGVDPGHADLSLSPDARYVLATGEHHPLGGIWSTKYGRRLPIDWPEDLPPARTQAWHPDGHHFATGHTDGSIAIWAVNPLRLVRRLPSRADIAPQLAWHPNGERLASTGRDHQIHIWAWETGESPLSLKEHTHEITGLAWSPDGLRLASCSTKGVVRLWDASAGYLMNRSIPDRLRKFGILGTDGDETPR
ncbi:MAG: hypothetical protein MI741_04650, partial [Rhodospirillales bacterium]|nr:hypothetical protein [Rhodospirillales bacterium]